MVDLEKVSVTGGLSTDQQGNEGVGIKLQGTSYELNVFVPLEEVPELHDLPKWEGGAKQIGFSANAPSFWSRDDGLISILIGHDDQTWDFGIWFEESALRQIIEEAEREAQSAT